MKENSNTLAAIFATTAALALGGAAGASPVSTVDILANWTAGADPVEKGESGTWFNSGGNLAGTGNHRGAIVSDFVAELDYAFSASFNPNDNDSFGVMFGYQDIENHYRISWSDDYGESGTEPNVIAHGQIGFRVVKVKDGENTLLFSSGTDYTSASNYSLSIQAKSGGGFSVVARNESTDSELESEMFSDSTFKSGKVGFHHLYMSGASNWYDVDFTQGTTEPMSPVPVPMSLPLIASGLGALVVMRRRKRG